MQKPENVSLIAESAFILFTFFLIAFSWPFLLNIDGLSPQFLFIYFFIVWFICIVCLFSMTLRYRSARPGNDKKTG